MKINNQTQKQIDKCIESAKKEFEIIFKDYSIKMHELLNKAESNFTYYTNKTNNKKENK